MSSIHSVKDGNLNNFVNENKRVVIKFGASWCGPCKAMSAPFASAAKNSNEEVKCVEVDIDECPNDSVTFQVRSVPTFLVFKEGVEIERKVGTVSSAVLTKWCS